MPSFRQGFGRVTAKAIGALEQELCVRLPEDYKRFLKTTNGGIPEPNVFTVPDRGEAMGDYLYGIRDKRTNCDLEREQKQAAQHEPLPAGFVVIGHDPGSSLLLMVTTGRQAGRIYFWDRVGFWIREDGKKTFPVAGSFSEFIESLHELAADE
jgi:hypothetical protein